MRASRFFVDHSFCCFVSLCFQAACHQKLLSLLHGGGARLTLESVTQTNFTKSMLRIEERLAQIEQSAGAADCQ